MLKWGIRTGTIGNLAPLDVLYGDTEEVKGVGGK